MVLADLAWGLAAAAQVRAFWTLYRIQRNSRLRYWLINCHNCRMLGFFDESGDPGLKIGRGSSRYFVTVLVTFEDDLAALECDRRISRLRGELKLPDSYEFHFVKNPWKIREAFLRSVQSGDFHCHIFVLDKAPGISGVFPFKDPESLYKYAVGEVFENAKPYLNELNVFADETGNRRFRDDLPRLLRSRLNPAQGERVLNRVRLQDSHRNNLLQLVDYAAGVTNRATSGDLKAIELWERYLRRKEVTRQVWPKDG